MTTFVDGPAAGQTLMLKRAPFFLRVVEKAGQFDALDQLDDTPSPEESIYAYQIEGTAGFVHINQKGGRGGFFTMANYRLCRQQPTDTEMRSSSAWRAWCRATIAAAAPPNGAVDRPGGAGDR